MAVRKEGGVEDSWRRSALLQWCEVLLLEPLLSCRRLGRPLSLQPQSQLFSPPKNLAETLLLYLFVLFLFSAVLQLPSSCSTVQVLRSSSKPESGIHAFCQGTM